ncbi:allatostatin-A receptor-like [Mytilus trossulus]|uniref:allatostatin-A receptor-like n=1 Tax=Mytilus trossulus TaxID=6551 RepID=UPI0030053953
MTFPVGCLGNLFVVIVVCSQRQERNSTDMLIVSLAVVDFLFIMVYVPFIVTTRVIGRWVFAASEFLAYANSCINPILYTFLLTKYRQSLRKLMCCKRQRPNN